MTLVSNRLGLTGTCIFVHKSLCHKLREDLNLNCDKIQPININISNIKAKNVDLNGIYRSPNGNMNMKQCEIHF